MKRKKRRIVLFLCVVMLILAGACTSSGAGPSSSAETSPPVETDAHEVQPIRWTEKVYRKEHTAEDGTVVMIEEYRLPAIENTDGLPERAAINAWYEKEAADLMENAEETAEWALSDYETAERDQVVFQPYADTETSAIKRASDRWVSVLRIHFIEVGGAEPAVFFFTDLFSLESGERMELADCFSTDWETAKSRILEEMLRLNREGAYGGAPLNEELIRNGFDPSLFYFTDEGLVIPFQADALGARSVVEPGRAIVYQALEDILAIW